MEKIDIKPVRSTDLSRELLYEADESRESVADYIVRGRAYAAFENGVLIGQYILLHTRPFTAEIINIAVAEKYRGQGIGKLLVAHAVETARQAGFKILEVSTGNAGTMQIAFYQKCGFRITHIEQDYIAKLYPEPIIENGISCPDMVRFQMYL